MRVSSPAPPKQIAFSTFISQFSQNSSEVLSEHCAWWSHHRSGLLFGLAGVCSQCAAGLHSTMPVLGMCLGVWTCDQGERVIRVNAGTARMDSWAGEPKSPLSAERWLWRHWSPWGEAHLYSLCRPKLNVPPTYSCETSLLFILFYKGLNSCSLGQNLIPVLQRWTVKIWKDFLDLFFCYSKADGQKRVIFLWGSQRKNQILLKTP